MYAEAIFLNLKPGTVEETRKLIEEKLVPWLRGRQGFHGLHAAKLGDKQMMVFDVWSSKKDLDAIRGEEEQLINRTFSQVLATPPEFKESDIVIHAEGHKPHAKERHAA